MWHAVNLTLGFVMVWVFTWIQGERSEKYKWDGCTTQRCECSAKTLSLSCNSSQKGFFSQQCTQSDFHIVHPPPNQSYADHIEMQLLIRLWQILRRTCSLTQKKKEQNPCLPTLHSISMFINIQSFKHEDHMFWWTV